MVYKVTSPPAALYEEPSTCVRARVCVSAPLSSRESADGRAVPPVAQPPDAKVCRVAVLGSPNAGKSAVINRIVDQKVSAVSAKYHTTRENVIGVRTEAERQLIVVDTPGIVGEKDIRRFNRALVRTAWSASVDADVCESSLARPLALLPCRSDSALTRAGRGAVLMVVDAAKKIRDSERELMLQLGEFKQK
jgi:hypothetical protein